MHAGAVDWERVVSFTFLLTHLAGAAVGLGARGEVGASDGMIDVAMSSVRWRCIVLGIYPSGAREMWYVS